MKVKMITCLNTVMASKGISRGTKRILREYDVESRDSQEKIQQICTTQNSAVRRTESDHLCFGGNEDRPVNSKRWKTCTCILCI
ncbi:hypothetical protein RchiOBHm_Chr4g0388401 [Rosa chinensis]|uniref:Uncharacterized protein n=1 Tax=Rosa chinensis TaxID=74649 RepID=A0A2P6QPS3_ROSCH|nr:hypothetical protein RchiOBHm_Chr4g0388401 [Rosa chinensis]